MADVIRTVGTTITLADGFSAGIPVQPNEFVSGVRIPAAWETSMDIGIDLSQDNSTWFPLIDSTRAAASSDFRFINLGGTAVIAIYSKFNLTAVYGTSFFRL